jgi:hypothetical protein
MRFMDMRPFERAIEIGDFDFLVRSRINQAIVLWPEQAFPLAGYMGWPNDLRLGPRQYKCCATGQQDRKPFRDAFGRFRPIGRGSLTSSTCTTTWRRAVTRAGGEVQALERR